MKDNEGDRCKKIQVEQERVLSFMTDSDDIPMISVDLLEAEISKP